MLLVIRNDFKYIKILGRDGDLDLMPLWATVGSDLKVIFSKFLN